MEENDNLFRQKFQRVGLIKIIFCEAKAALNSCCAHLLGRGMLGGGLGTVGIGIGRGPLPGTWTPAAATL